jgi:hypothetical protein
MLGIRLLVVVVALLFASSAGAGTLMYQGKWVSDSFGNDVVGGPTESQYFSILANPLGVNCNANAPVCKFASTPVDNKGVFRALGPYCTPYSNFGPTRPAKGQTATTMGGVVSTVSKGLRYRTPPLYRNKAFFTAGGGPDVNNPCNATTTIGGAGATAYLSPFDAQRGPAQRGAPVSGSGSASVNTAVSPPAFTFAAAPATGTGGMRRTTLGSFSLTPPYLYSYTYRTLRNDAGNFFAGGGPGSLSFKYYQGANTVAKAVVKAGKNQFGGTMRLLGTEEGKVCFFLGQGCSLGGADWKYRYVGDAPTTTTYGSVRQIVSFTEMYYNTAGMGSSTVMVIGSRFPWTTGTVTVTAAGRGPHRTIEQRKGMDNRDSKGVGTIQLVTPIITKWLQPAANFETGGIGALRLEFTVPEPQKWMMLVAGLSLVGVLYRARPR